MVALVLNTRDNALLQLTTAIMQLTTTIMQLTTTIRQKCCEWRPITCVSRDRQRCGTRQSVCCAGSIFRKFAFPSWRDVRLAAQADEQSSAIRRSSMEGACSCSTSILWMANTKRQLG